VTSLEALQKAALFRDFTETGLKIFAAIAAEKSLVAGTPLFTEDSVGESLFIVKSGTVKLVRKTADGEEELATLGAGEHVGELALLASSIRLVTAIAATRCELLEITHRDFVRIQPQKPQACLKLALAIAGEVARKAVDAREALRGIAVANGKAGA
jgi:CRP/FNR family transcriptional regulator, cyclic AMP receptor protein